MLTVCASLSLVVSGSLAGATGLVLASTVGSGDPSAGTSYLLPAFAAAFLGATQLKHGRFNAFGTLIAVLLLGTGTTGLALANAPQWSADMFVGLVLIASLAVTGIQRRASVGDGGRFRTLFRRAASERRLTSASHGDMRQLSLTHIPTRRRQQSCPD